jgi:hypothetical protein
MKARIARARPPVASAQQVVNFVGDDQRRPSPDGLRDSGAQPLSRIGNGQLPANFSSEVFANLAVPRNCLDFIRRRIAPDGMTSSLAFEHTSMSL